MAKLSGGVRVLKVGSKGFNARRKEYWQLIESGKYRDGYFSDMSGGYWLEEKSSNPHSEGEREAAQILADHGYKVVLIDESGSSIKVDGTIFSFTYEQRTPYAGIKAKKMPKTGNAKNFENALEHAMKKKADYAVVYMKQNKHTKQTVSEGLKKFEEHNQYRFKQLIVVTKDGRIHRHRHDS